MLRICYDNIHQQGDLACDEAGHDTTHALETAVLLSLLCDRRAKDEDDVGEGVDRRGWWADAYAIVPNDEWGSRLWLLERGKANSGTLLFAREAAEESLQWLIEDGIARAVEVDTSWISGRPGYLRTQVRVFRPERLTPQLLGPWEIYYAL